MTAFVAFLHHLAAFALVAALAVEFVFIKGELNAQAMHRIRGADAVYGLSSGVLLLVGLLRVFYFEKGAAYYFHSAPFIAKLSLFVIVGLLSVYPTVVFAGWGRQLRQGQVPVVGDAQRRLLRRIMHWELLGVTLIVLCAALMAKGIGTFG